MSSVALPNVALSKPPSAGLVRPASSSVASPIYLASGTIASGREKKQKLAVPLPRIAQKSAIGTNTSKPKKFIHSMCSLQGYCTIQRSCNTSIKQPTATWAACTPCNRRWLCAAMPCNNTRYNPAGASSKAGVYGARQSKCIAPRFIPMAKANIHSTKSGDKVHTTPFHPEHNATQHVFELREHDHI